MRFFWGTHPAHERLERALRLLHKGKIETALAELATVADSPVSPRSVKFHALWAHAVHCVQQGQYHDAVPLFERARDHAYNDEAKKAAAAAIAHYGQLLGRFDLVLDAARRWVALDERSALAHYVLAVGLKKSDRLEEALPSLEEAIRLAPTEPTYRLVLAGYRWARGDESDATSQREAIEREIGEGKLQVQDAIAWQLNLAWFAAVTADAAVVADQLERAIKAAKGVECARHYMRAYVATEPDFDPFRRDERFATLVAELAAV